MWRRLLVIAALGFMPCACAASVRSVSTEAARKATPEVFYVGLEKLENPEVADRLARALATPQVQAAIRELSSGVAEGTLEGLSRESQEERIDELVNRFAHAAVEALSDPRVDYAVRRSTDRALDEATSPENRARVQALASALTESVLATAGREIPSSVATAMREELRDDVGPAIREVMAQDVAPALASALRSPALRSALDETVHDLATQAVLGSTQGFVELHRRHGGFTEILAFFAQHLWLLVPLCAPLLLMIPIIVLWRKLVAARRFREEVERRDALTTQRWRLHPVRPGHVLRERRSPVSAT
jgi:hypothetical protein